jgi:hypothetical protein
MKLPFSLLLIAVLFTRCLPDFGKQKQLNADQLYGTWIAADLKDMRPDTPEDASADKIEQSKELVKLLESQLRVSVLKTGPALSLFNDGTYTRITEATYETGNWQLNEGNNIAFEPKTGKTPYQQKMKLDGDGLLAFEVKEAMYAYQLVMRHSAPALEKPEKDPFHPSKNVWRIKPTAPENPNEIRARMKNHLEHYQCILTAASERKAKVVSFERSPSCVQIYNGGIGLRREGQIDKPFIDCFYDSAQADTAIQYFFVEGMRKLQTAGEATGNWIVDDANLIEMLLSEF